jgi:hypothetical protein
MIQKVVNSILTFAIFGLSLYLIEGACFRLVEPYAQWRLQFAWGEPSYAKLNPIFKTIPTDHSFAPPDASSFYGGMQKPLDLEFEYAQKITSFNRPSRDRYYNYLMQEVNPLRNFEMTDLGIVKGVLVPGMRRPANSIDVDFGLARREGLPVPFSNALFLYVIPQGPRSAYESAFVRLEGPFSFLLNHGISCVLLDPKSPDELLTQFKYLKSQHPNFAENIFVYAEGEAVSVTCEAIQEESQLITSLMVKNPAKPISSKIRSSVAWFIGLLSDGKTNQEVQNSLLEIVRANRNHPNIYKSRLSGLLFQESKVEKFLSSDLMCFLLTCLNISEEIKDLTPEGAPDKEWLDSNSSERADLSSFSELDESKRETALQDNSISQDEPTFDCDVIREYRLLNADDSQIANLSNRELVLTLGLSFENLGDEVLEQIAEKDPLFYRFYLSLKEIHSTDK